MLIPSEPIDDGPLLLEPDKELLSETRGGIPGTIGELLDSPDTPWGHLNFSPTSRSLSASCSAEPGSGCTTNWK